MGGAGPRLSGHIPAAATGNIRTEIFPHCPKKEVSVGPLPGCLCLLSPGTLLEVTKYRDAVTALWHTLSFPPLVSWDPALQLCTTSAPGCPGGYLLSPISPAQLLQCPLASQGTPQREWSKTPCYREWPGSGHTKGFHMLVSVLLALLASNRGTAAALFVLLVILSKGPSFWGFPVRSSL